MVTIHVVSNYFIDIDDGNNYTTKIDTLKTDKDDKKIYKNLGYYGDLKGSLNGILKYYINDEANKKDIKEIKEYLFIYDDLQKSFCRLLTDLEKEV